MTRACWARVLAAVALAGLVNAGCKEPPPAREPERVPPPSGVVPKEADALEAGVGAPAAPAPARVRVTEIVLTSRGRKVVVKDGACVEIARAGTDEVGGFGETHVRCPGADRIRAVLDDAGRSLDGATFGAPATADAGAAAPGLRVVMEPGGSRTVTSADRVAKVAALLTTLESALLSERPRKGEKTPSGFTGLRLMGRATRTLSGERLEGVMDVEVTTGGGYLCEIVARSPRGASRETRAGVTDPKKAADLIERALAGASPSRTPPGPVTVRAMKGEALTVVDVRATEAALDRILPLLAEIGGACAAELRRGVDTPLARARRAAKAGKHDEVRRLLAPRVLGKSGALADEVALLRAACEALRDNKCIIRLKEKQPPVAK